MKLAGTINATMIGRVDRCVLLSYRVPAAAAAGLVPAPLELITHDSRGERWAFWNVVVCHIEAMRPEFLPEFLGITYHHVAYRLRVRAATVDGTMNGLYFLRSDVDDGMLAAGGEMLSDFKLRRSKIVSSLEPSRFVAAVDGRDAEATARLEVDLAGTPERPEDSVFGSVEEARAFLKYQPMGLAPTADGRKIRLAEVQRNEGEWLERPVRVAGAEFGFLKSRAPGAVLELATWVEPIDYRWRLGRTVRLFQEM